MKNSSIGWTHHTFNPSSFRVRHFVAWSAERDSIAYFEPEFGMRGERHNVMCVEVSACSVAAFLAGEPVTMVDVIPPSFKFQCIPKTKSFVTFPIDISVGFASSRSPLSCDLTYLSPDLDGMLFTNSVARTSLGGLTHFFSTLFGHLFPFHGRDKGKPSFNPSFPNNITSAQPSF